MTLHRVTLHRVASQERLMVGGPPLMGGGGQLFRIGESAVPLSSKLGTCKAVSEQTRHIKGSHGQILA